MPPVVVGKCDLPLHAAIPAKLMSALARDMVTLLTGFVAAAEFAPPRTWLPAHSQGTPPHLLMLSHVVLSLLLSCHLLLALLTGEARVWAELAVAAEPMTPGTS